MAKPTVTAVSPTGGPASGATLVSITGTNFTNVASVAFGKYEMRAMRQFSTEALAKAAVEKGYDGAYFVESSTKIKAFSPYAVNGAEAANVVVTNKEREASAKEEANSWQYWAPHTVQRAANGFIETIPLGAAKSGEAKGSFYEAAGSETKTIPLIGNFGRAAYIQLEYNYEELSGTPKVQLKVEYNNGLEWVQLPAEVKTGVVETVSKKAEGVVAITDKPIEAGNLRLSLIFTAAGGIAGTVTVAGFESDQYAA